MPRPNEDAMFATDKKSEKATEFLIMNSEQLHHKPFCFTEI